jgi:(p)ppGpp synthase/HD superfamily hydrolase
MAVVAHDGQTREDGTPYIMHPLRIMMSMDTVEEKIVAILHDVVEDTETGIEQIEAAFTPYIAEVVNKLSRRSTETYETYIKQILVNSMATKIKMADLRDNLNLLELKKFDDYRVKRARKYIKAYKTLEACAR